MSDAYQPSWAGDNTAAPQNGGAAAYIMPREGTAQNPNSSAVGPGQFINSTWLDMIQKYRPELAHGKTPDQILSMRTDPQYAGVAKDMTNAYAAENSEKLSSAGLQPTPSNIYLSHFAGPQGAISVLKADPNTPVSKILSPDAIKANPNIANMTAGQLQQWAGGRQPEGVYGGAMHVTVTPQWAQPQRAQAPQGPATSPSQQIAIDFNNQQQAAAQGTTPIISAQQPNLIGPAMVNDAGEIGYKDPQGNFTPTDKNKHVVLTDPNDNIPKVYSRSDNTNESRLSSAGRLLGTMMGTGNIELSQTPGAVRAVQAAQRIGVDKQIPRVIMSNSPTMQYLGQFSKGMPGGAPLVHGIDEARSAVGGAVKSAANIAGGAANRSGAGEGFAAGVKQALRAKTGQPESFLGRAVQGVSDAYDNVSKFVNPNIKTPLSNTAAKVQEISASREAAQLPDKLGGAAKTVLSAATDPKGLTFDGIKTLRTKIGDMLDTGRIPEGTDEGELRAIYATLSKDLGAAAENAGGAAGKNAFQQANSLAKMLATWKDKLRQVLGPKTRSGEGIYEAIMRMAGDGPSADIRGLTMARSAVPERAWRDVASTAISTLGLDSHGEFSPAIFLRDYNGLSDAGKRVLFGGIGHSNLVGFLDDIAKVSNKFVQAGKLANTSGTAGHTGLAVAATAAAEGILRGSWVEPLVAVGAIVGNNILARALRTPATAAAMARWSNIYGRFVQKGGAVILPAFRRASGELANSINGAFGTGVTPDAIMRSVQSPAASNANENQ